MSEAARKTWIVALAVGLLAYVYGPLLGVGPFGRDLALITALSEIQLDTPGALYSLPGIKDRPLAALSLVISRKLWVPAGTWYGPEITFLRLENLGLLLLAAFALRHVLARSLAPFLGADQARSASVAASLFLVLHPLAVSSVARATERGELIAMAAGLWGLHLFLRARQDREYAPVAAAGILFAVAAFAGRVAVFLPPLVAGLEFCRQGATGAKRNGFGQPQRPSYWPLCWLEWSGAGDLPWLNREPLAADPPSAMHSMAWRCGSRSSAC